MDFLISMTVTFSVTTILILIIKSLFKNRFTPKWHVIIWAVLIIRLAIPTLPESNISIFNFVPDIQGIYGNYIENITKSSLSEQRSDSQEVVSSKEDKLKINQKDITDKTNETNEKLSVRAASENQGKMVTTFNERETLEKSVATEITNKIEKIVLIIYALGFFIMSATLIFSYIRVIRKMMGLPVCTDDKILRLFDSCKEEVGIRGNTLKLKQGVQSTMLVGIINPVIYISERYNFEELRHVFYHELCHYKNRDTIWNVVSSALLCINWFNPLAWYAFKSFKCDLEIYCDNKVINMTGEKKAYAEMLLKTASARSSFITATPCLENGEKEVSQRIKRIAYFKKPKAWVSAAGLVLAAVLAIFCLTNAADISEKTQIIGVSGPNNQRCTYMMEVPLSWGDDYKEIMQKQEPLCENIMFSGKNGEKKVGLTYRKVDLSEYEAVSEGSNAISMKGRVNYEKKVKELVKQSESFSQLEDNKESNLKIERLKSNSAYIWDAYKINYLKEGKEVRSEIYLIADQYTTIIPVLYKESGDITEQELIKAAMTLSKVKEPSEYSPTAEAGTFIDSKKGIAVVGGDYDARALMEEYFDNYVDIKMPPSRDIKGYKISSFKEIEPMGDVPRVTGMMEDGIIKGERVPWNIIYPTAKVYKVDYELIPEDKEKFADTEGEGFSLTKRENKYYNESYAVFYSYSVDGKNYKAEFLGFLSNVGLSDQGVDYPVYKMINNYFERDLLSKIFRNAHVKYVGDMSKDGKLVGLLPLHEYTNGMELQTTKEPYGITVNYKIGRDEPYDAEKGGILSSWPEADGDLSGLYSTISPGELNMYIKKQFEKNAKNLVMEIENSGSASIKCESPYLENNYNFVYSDPYKNKSQNE